MNLFELVSLIIIIIMLIYSIFQYARVELFLKKIKTTHTEQHETKKVYVIIPCLREQNCIEKTVKYFKSIVDKNIKIIIVTTQKENKEYYLLRKSLEDDLKKLSKDKLIKKYKNLKLSYSILKEIHSKSKLDEFFQNIPTTYNIIQDKILRKYDDVFLIDYPNENGYMADQINYTIDNLEKIVGDKIGENEYVAIYNADSKPDEKTFEEFMQVKGNPKVIQQYSYSMKNYDNINFLLKGFSIYQTNFEIKTGLINSYFKSKFLYTHVVGHGLFLRYDFIKAINGLNNMFWCEDIYLTLYLKFNNIEIVPLINLENMETANSMSNLVKQNGVWFKTTSNFYQMYKYAKKNSRGKFTINGIIGTINELRCATNWLFFPFVVFYSIIVALLNKNLLLLFGIIFVYCFYIITYVFSTIRTINRVTNKSYIINIKMVLATLIATLISNIGPLYSLLLNPKNKHKTER